MIKAYLEAIKAILWSVCDGDYEKNEGKRQSIYQIFYLIYDIDKNFDFKLLDDIEKCIEMFSECKDGQFYQLNKTTNKIDRLKNNLA